MGSSKSKQQDENIPKKAKKQHEEGIHRVLGTKISPPFPEHTDYIILGPGCFWAGEKTFWRLPGVYTTASGFAPDRKSKKSSDSVEVVLVVFNPDIISVADILRMFLQCHNPTQKGGQGNDIGQAYRSAIYFHTEEQQRIAKAAVSSYKISLGNREIATDIMNASLNNFSYVSDGHQQYLASPGARKYASVQPQNVNMVPNGDWLPEDLKLKYKPKLSEKFWKKHAPTFQSVLNVPHEQISLNISK